MIALLALLQGCGFGLVADREVDSAEPVGDVAITSVSPGTSGIGGGTLVTIAGTGFEGEIRVTFGGVPAQNVVTLSTTEVQCETPPVDRPVVADVKVQSDLGEATFTGFQFVDDGTGGDDTGDTDTGVPPDDDAVGGVVQLGLVQYACPNCYDPPRQSVETTAVAVFHAASSTGWYDWMPNLGQCVVDAATTAPSGPYFDVGAAIELTGSTTLSVPRSSGPDGTTYVDTAVAQTTYLQGSTWNLVASGGADAGAFTVSGALERPSGFDTISPSSIIDTRNTFTAPIARSGTSIYWSPTGVGEFVLVELEVYNPQGTALVATVVCKENDDGRIDIPASALSSAQPGGLVAVTIKRYNLIDFTLPGNGGGEGAAFMGVAGTGIVQ